jgi:spore coat protein U-like protein
MRAVAITALVLACWLAGTSSARAGCTLSATGVAFGAYSVFSSGPSDSTGSVSYYCDKHETYIVIALGRGGESSFSRKLRGGAEQLSYNLYLDATRSAVWGDTTGGTTVYYNPQAPHKKQVTVTVYGRIPSGQDVAVGTYSDSIVATMIF